MELRKSLGLVLLAGIWGCSASGDDGAGLGPGAPAPGSGGGGAGPAAGLGGAVLAPGVGGGVVIITTGGSDGAPVGDGTPEICDGLDNDGNGIIDDVDVGGDGICDCLNIATIGSIGPWSDGGNLFASWLGARSPQGAVALGDQELTEELLRPFQVVVVLHVDTTEITGNSGAVAPAHHAFTEAEAQAFSAWVRGGGGVMTTIGYAGWEEGEVVNINRLLNPLGMGYSTTSFDVTGYIEDWAPHPVTEGVSRILMDNGTSPEGPAGTNLARDAAGRVALQIAAVEAGRVVVWGDEWITYDSEWSDVTDQQVELFWVNIIKWLTPPGQCQVPIPETLIR